MESTHRSYGTFWQAIFHRLTTYSRTELWHYFLPHYLYLTLMGIRVLVGGLCPPNHPLYHLIDQPASVLIQLRLHYSTELLLLCVGTGSAFILHHWCLFFRTSPLLMSQVIDSLLIRNYRHMVTDNQIKSLPDWLNLWRNRQQPRVRPLFPFRSLSPQTRVRLALVYWINENIFCFGVFIAGKYDKYRA